MVSVAFRMTPHVLISLSSQIASTQSPFTTTILYWVWLGLIFQLWKNVLSQLPGCIKADMSVTGESKAWPSHLWYSSEGWPWHLLLRYVAFLVPALSFLGPAGLGVPASSLLPSWSQQSPHCKRGFRLFSCNFPAGSNKVRYGCWIMKSPASDLGCISPS